MKERLVICNEEVTDVGATVTSVCQEYIRQFGLPYCTGDEAQDIDTSSSCWQS